MATFKVTDIPDMTGKSVIVTGAGSGIGLATARSDAARDPALARRLWDASEQLTGVLFPLLPAPHLS